MNFLNRKYAQRIGIAILSISLIGSDLRCLTFLFVKSTPIGVQLLVISIKENEFQFDLNKRLNLKIKCFISNYFQHRFFKYCLKISAKLLQLIFSKNLFIIFISFNILLFLKY